MAQTQLDLDRGITERIGRFADVLSSAVFAQSQRDLVPVMTEVDELLAKACILERLVFALNVLKTAGVPRTLIDRLLADNFLVARMLTSAGFGLDDERTIRLLSTRDEAFQLDVASHEGISERITDYLLEIGGSEVAYRLARNRRAKLSPTAIVALVERAQNDHRLLQALANRRDLDGAADTGTEHAAKGTGADPKSTPPTPKRRASRTSKLFSHR
jgi:uncharacterized protein (DUF2336 family)